MDISVIIAYCILGGLIVSLLVGLVYVEISQRKQLGEKPSEMKRNRLQAMLSGKNNKLSFLIFFSIFILTMGHFLFTFKKAETLYCSKASNICNIESVDIFNHKNQTLLINYKNIKDVTINEVTKFTLEGRTSHRTQFYEINFISDSNKIIKVFTLDDTNANFANYFVYNFNKFKQSNQNAVEIGRFSGQDISTNNIFILIILHYPLLLPAVAVFSLLTLYLIFLI